MPRISITIFYGLVTLLTVQARADVVGKAISLEGQVKIFINGQAPEVNLKPGDPVSENDKVLTGKRSNARFLLKDETILDLKENSQFRFEKLTGGGAARDAEFSLDFGRVRASVNKKLETGNNYKIKTRASTFAVRGTDFVIAAGAQDSSKLTVFEGRVKSDSGSNSAEVDPGFELLAKGDVFKKQQLTPAQIESVFQQSRTDDMTFYQNLVVDDFRSSRNFGAATIQTVSKLVTAPAVQIPRDAIKVPGVSQLSASAVSPGILNYVITNVGVKIQ